jgi:RNA polymerase sigma-70 factor (ECF subfamily)
MNCTTDSEDDDCIRRCLDGDADAFEGLVVRYQKPVFNAIYRMVQNREDAAEICQAVFLKAYVNLRAFDRERRFFSWIYRIAMNDSINFLSSRRSAEPIAANYESPAAGPEQHLEASELRKHLNRAIEQLSPDQRAVLVLRHFTHCSYQEIASTLQLPETTVKSRLFDARQCLREYLSAAGYRRGVSNA